MSNSVRAMLSECIPGLKISRRSSFKGLLSEFEQAKTDSARLGAELASLKDDYAHLSEQKTTLDARCAPLSEAAERLTIGNARLASEHAKIAALLVAEKAETERLASQIGTLSAERDRLASEHAEIAARLLVVKAETERLTGRVDGLIADREHLTREHADAIARLGEERASSERLTLETSRLGDENARLANERAEVSARLIAEQAESVRLTQEVGGHAAENARLASDNADISARLLAVQTESERLIQESSRLTAEVARLAAEHAEEAARVANEHAEERARLVSEHAEERARLANEHAEIYARLQAAMAESERLTREGTRVTAENARLACEHADMAARLAEKTESQRLMREADRLTSETVHLSIEPRRLIIHPFKAKEEDGMRPILEQRILDMDAPKPDPAIEQKLELGKYLSEAIDLFKARKELRDVASVIGAQSLSDRLTPHQFKRLMKQQQDTLHLDQRKKYYRESEPSQMYQGFSYEIIRRLILSDPSIGSSLNIGCNYAYMDWLLAKQFENVTFRGVDVNPDLDEINSDLKLENTDFYSGYALELIESGKLHADLVYTSSASTVIRNLELRTYARLIAQKAKYFLISEPIWTLPGDEIIDPKVVHPLDSVPAYVQREPLTGDFGYLCWIHNYRAIIESAGFDVVEYRFFKPEFGPYHWCLVLGQNKDANLWKQEGAS